MSSNQCVVSEHVSERVLESCHITTGRAGLPTINNRYWYGPTVPITGTHDLLSGLCLNTHEHRECSSSVPEDCVAVRGTPCSDH